MSETLTKQQLIEKIKLLYETDAGDFKRKITLYLNDMIETQSSLEIKKKLEEIKNKLLYQPASSSNQADNIESLRWLLMESLNELPIK